MGKPVLARFLFQMGCLADRKTLVTPPIWTLGDVVEGPKGGGNLPPLLGTPELTEALLKRSFSKQAMPCCAATVPI